MIFVDASAIVALVLAEPEAMKVARVIDSGKRLFTSPVAIYEAALAISRSHDISLQASEREVLLIIRRGRMDVAELGEATAHAALTAFERFGKGRHPARLNMGDCFAYAVAKSRNAAILFVGDDFIHTDLSNALAA